jgi:hypothetical protein
MMVRDGTIETGDSPPITDIRIAREETVIMTEQELDNAVEALAVLVTRHWDYLRQLHRQDVTLAA